MLQQFHSWVYIKTVENKRCSDKNLYRNVYVGAVHNSQKVETAQAPINA